MYQGTDIVGKTIITHDEGAKVGEVLDVLFSAKHNKVLALLLEEEGIFSNAKVVPFANIHAIGPDSIIVPTADAVTSSGDDETLSGMLSDENIAVGTRIMTDSGEDMGKMNDIFFDETSGIIEGYEVSGGIFADAYSGKTYLPAPTSFRIGEDVAFIPDSTADMMKEQTGGIKGAAITAADKASDLAGQATSKIGDLTHQAGEKISDLAGQAGEKLTDAKDSALEAAKNTSASASVDQAMGRRVLQLVRASNGNIIAGGGQIVTQAVIDRAKKYDAEAPLLEAVNMTPGQAASGAAKDSLSHAGNVVQDGATKAGRVMGDVWKSIKSKATEAKGSMEETVEKKRIDSVLGKATSRVILDKNDEAILNVGDIITHEAINKAREADVLSIVFSAAVDPQEVAHSSNSSSSSSSDDGIKKVSLEIEK